MSGPLSEVPEFQLDDEEGADEVPGMNMTPMVDVIFILLVFFLCVTQFKSGKLELDLAKARSEKQPQQTEEQKKPVVIEINKAGKVVIDKEECPTAGAQKAAIQKIFKDRGELQSVLLRCDGKAEFRLFLQLRVLLSDSGLKKIDIEYDPTGGKS